MSYYLKLRYHSPVRIEEKDKETKALLRKYGGTIEKILEPSEDVSNFRASFKGDMIRAQNVVDRISSRLNNLVEGIIIIQA